MQTLYLMDRLINKPVKLNSVADQIFIKSGDKVIYKETNQNGQTVMAVGINLGYEVDTVKTGTFVEILDSNKVKQFEQYQQQALTYFPQFRKEFKQLFPDSTPITARSNILGDTVYFYFYAETRYNFSDFVKNFRNKINKRFFIYQVGARDMMRLHPESKLYLVDCGCGPMGCCGTGPLPTIEMETIALQGLEGRDVEKLKGRCGKLKCSLVFEQYLYEQEAKKFPRKGTVIRYGEKTGKCINYNILTQEVTIRTEEGDVIRAGLTDIDRSKHNTPTSEIITQTAV